MLILGLDLISPDLFLAGDSETQVGSFGHGRSERIREIVLWIVRSGMEN